MLNYQNLKGTLERLIITQEQVLAQIDRLLYQHRKITEITHRPSQEGDELILDYIGTVSGVAFEGGSGKNETLVLGSGKFIPGFEEQLLNHNVGDKVDVHVTFPEHYHAEQLAGQKAVFHCTIHSIRESEQYKADDTFAQEVFHLENFKALEEAMREQFQNYVDQKAEEELQNNLLDQLCANVPLNATDKQISQAVDLEMKSLEARLAKQNLTLAAYAQFSGETVEQIREDYIPDAKKNLLRQQVIFQIAEEQNIEADEQSVADAITRLCRENKMTIDEIQKYMTEDFQNAVVRSVITDKVLQRIRDAADVTVVEK